MLCEPSKCILVVCYRSLNSSLMVQVRVENRTVGDSSHAYITLVTKVAVKVCHIFIWVIITLSVKNFAVTVTILHCSVVYPSIPTVTINRLPGLRANMAVYIACLQHLRVTSRWAMSQLCSCSLQPMTFMLP